MNKIDIYYFEATPVRVIDQDGEPWFVGRDVAAALGYSNPNDALSKHVPAAHKGVSRIATPSGDQEMTMIDEAGMYRLIMRSRTPAADRFQEWVTAEVLPSIRKTGNYISDPVAQYNQQHAIEAANFMTTYGQAITNERRPHYPGRTYVVMTSPVHLKVGGGGYADMEHTVGNLIRKGTGAVLRVISGGYSREMELQHRLAPFRSNEGVDWFDATPKALFIVQSYRWAPNSHAIVDAYNAQLISRNMKAIAA